MANKKRIATIKIERPRVVFGVKERDGVESRYRKISQLDKKIRRAQKSTGTLFNLAIPLHDKLRQRFNWYYRWHMLPLAPLIHWLVLYCYIFGFIAVFYSAYLFIPINQPTSASTGGPNTPATIASDSSNGGIAPWSNPGNTANSDDSWATATTAMGGFSYYLKATDFGFSIPAGATINGVTARIERHSDSYTGLGVKDNTVKLVKGGLVSGESRADTTTAWPTSDSVKTYGSGSDLWGVALSAADVNAADFGLVLSTTHFNPSGLTAYVDQFTVTIDYTVSIPTIGFSATSSSGSESVAGVNLAVSLSASSASDVTVEFSAGGSAAAGSDYSVATTTPLTIPAGTTTGNIALSVTDDSADESDETVVITLFNPTNATLGTNSAHTYSIIDNDETAAATPTTYTITASAGSHGSISPSGKVGIESGRSQAFTISPDSGYHIDTLQVDDALVTPVGSYTFSNVAANHTINAVFAADTAAATAGASSDGAQPNQKSTVRYTITTSAGEGGTIVPSGAVSVKMGENQSFVIAASTGFRIKDIKVDETSLTGITYSQSYTHSFEGVGRDHTLATEFEVAPIATPVDLPVSEATAGPVLEDRSSPLSGASDFILQGLKTIGVGSEAAAPTLSTTAAAVTAVSLGLAAASNTVTLFSFPELFHSLWYSIIALGTVRRRRRRWGRVIEEGTGISLPGVRITLLSAEDGKVIGTTLTGSDGSFAFAAPPGRYRLVATKDLYEIAVGGKDSFKPDDIIEIKDYNQGLIVPTIIMATRDEKVRSRQKLIGGLNRLEKFISYFSVLVLLFGTIVAADEVISAPNLRNIIFAVVYLVFWAINARVVMKRSPWGNVIDKADAAPISLALVRIIDKKGDRLVKTAVTNEAGKFSVFISRGIYNVAVAKPGYEMKEAAPFVVLERLRAVNRSIVLERV